jgi:hypothetical protein
LLGLLKHYLQPLQQFSHKYFPKIIEALFYCRLYSGWVKKNFTQIGFFRALYSSWTGKKKTTGVALSFADGD